MTYFDKYNKYKTKYLALKKQLGGGNSDNILIPCSISELYSYREYKNSFINKIINDIEEQISSSDILNQIKKPIFFPQFSNLTYIESTPTLTFTLNENFDNKEQLEQLIESSEKPNAIFFGEFDNRNATTMCVLIDIYKKIFNLDEHYAKSKNGFSWGNYFKYRDKTNNEILYGEYFDNRLNKTFRLDDYNIIIPDNSDNAYNIKFHRDEEIESIDMTKYNIFIGCSQGGHFAYEQVINSASEREKENFLLIIHSSTPTDDQIDRLDRLKNIQIITTICENEQFFGKFDLIQKRFSKINTPNKHFIPFKNQNTKSDHLREPPKLINEIFLKIYEFINKNNHLIKKVDASTYLSDKNDPYHLIKENITNNELLYKSLYYLHSVVRRKTPLFKEDVEPIFFLELYKKENILLLSDYIDLKRKYYEYLQKLDFIIEFKDSNYYLHNQVDVYKINKLKENIYNLEPYKNNNSFSKISYLMSNDNFIGNQYDSVNIQIYKSELKEKLGEPKNSIIEKKKYFFKYCVCPTFDDTPKYYHEFNGYGYSYDFDNECSDNDINIYKKNIYLNDYIIIYNYNDKQYEKINNDFFQMNGLFCYYYKFRNIYEFSINKINYTNIEIFFLQNGILYRVKNDSKEIINTFEKFKGELDQIPNLTY